MLSTLSFIANHPLTQGRRLAAFTRFARWQFASRLGGEVEVDWIEGAKLIARHGMTGATGNIYCGLHEFADMALLLHLMRPGDLFIDAGANVGSYTILASKVVGAASVAFEPDPGTAASLRRNLAANGIESLVTVHETALGEERGTIRFTIGLDTTNHIAAEGEAGRDVPLAPLDDFALTPTFMKFDLEGFEEPAFRGAAKTLSSPGLIGLITELASPDVVAMMAAHGLKRRRYDPWSRTFDDGPISGGNTVFLRDEAEALARVSAAPRRSAYGAIF